MLGFSSLGPTLSLFGSLWVTGPETSWSLSPSGREITEGMEGEEEEEEEGLECSTLHSSLPNH